MDLNKEKKLFELNEKHKKLYKNQSEKEEKYRKVGMPNCFGTLDDLKTYQDERAKIEEEINALK